MTRAACLRHLDPDLVDTNEVPPITGFNSSEPHLSPRSALESLESCPREGEREGRRMEASPLV